MSEREQLRTEHYYQNAFVITYKIKALKEKLVCVVVSTFQQTVEMAAVDVDVVENALRDVNLSSRRETVLKPQQESAVRALLADRDVLPSLYPFSLSPSPLPLPFLRLPRRLLLH